MVWLGLHRCHNVVGTFALYHGCCLLPAIIFYRNLWLGHLQLPTRKQVAIMLCASVFFSLLAAFLFSLLGDRLISKQHVLQELASRGWTRDQFYPLVLYFLTVNPVLEELFWRGVIINGLTNKRGEMDFRLQVWVAWCFAAWHYLVLRVFFQQFFAESIVVGIAVVGGALAYLYRKYKSLVLPILWHSLVFDMLVIVVLFMLIGP